MKLRAHYALAPVALLLAWSAGVPRAADYVNLDREAEPLRAKFNADRGKVRLVMLVAPT